jgi:hypothetical protein
MGYMLTTIDNPFNPFTQYDEWYNFDESQGYHTCGLLARIAVSSDELSTEDELLAIDVAMNEIITINLSGKHIKVTEDYVPRVLNTE